MASPNSLKRRYDDAGLGDSTNKTQELHARTADFTASNLLSSHQHQGTFPVFPPTAHNEPTPIRPTVQEPVMHGPPDSTATVVEKTNKRPKLTFAEKEAKRIEKEFKDRQRADDLAKKEEEKLRKEKDKAEREKDRSAKAEEKRLKEEERKKVKEEKDRLREEEKTKKEEERQKKEEEKNKKARSQLRLNAFFGQPSLTRSSTASPSREGSAPLGSPQSLPNDLGSTDLRQRRSISPSATPRKPHISEFERAFPPFFVQSHTSLAPPHRFARDEAGLQWTTDTIDKTITDGGEPSASTVPNFAHLLHIRPKNSATSRPRFRVKDIISQMDGNSKHPIDLTGSFRGPQQKPEEMLKEVPMKFLKFREDVRPPYIGTCSRFNHMSIPKMARKPCEPNLPGVDYNYDSEAEWEEPEEGEELDSEGEEEAEDEDEDEMEGFLDDEDAGDGKAVKRRPLLGDQEPNCSGICWAGESAVDHSAYNIDMLLEVPCFPIDPYSTSYWQQSTPAKPVNPHSILPHQSASMEPPRAPLIPINISNLPLQAQQDLQPLDVTKPRLPASGAQYSDSTTAKQVKRLIPNDLAEEFKSAVFGSDMTKLGLVEQLKKKFPKQSKDVIRDSLDMIAERVGPTKADKKWVPKAGV